MDEPLATRALSPRAALSPRVKAGGVAILVLVGLGCAVLVSAVGDHGAEVPVPHSSATKAGVAGAEIYVHILGAVQRPGLYAVQEGDRAVDVVAAAGGFLETADQAQLNLARFVVDGEQILVPAIGATPPGEHGIATSGLVNINTADEATLETLPRVGPAMAARIIEWRETNGRFTAIEDLMGVTGIGEKTFEGLKDLVSV